MASITREVPLDLSPDEAWAKIEDPARINEWFTFLGEVTYDAETSSRQCAMGDDMLDELIVDVDADGKRLAYAFLDSPFGFTQHSASMQVVDRDGGSTLVWTHDFKPDEIAPALGEALDGAVATITAG
ncbi:MAG: SRPBCC family protein [Actinomycetota bacterium]